MGPPPLQKLTSPAPPTQLLHTLYNSTSIKIKLGAKRTLLLKTNPLGDFSKYTFNRDIYGGLKHGQKTITKKRGEACY